jgi:hypothetical protein
MNKRIRPFSCGTQYGDWYMSNCDRCKKGAREGQEGFKCDIDEALFEAYFGDGTVSREIAERMGAIENEGAYTWKCPEVEWTDEWKKEVEERKRIKRRK